MTISQDQNLYGVYGPADTRTPWINRDTQAEKAPVSSVDDQPIPVYLRVGKNLLSPRAFQIAARKLLPGAKLRIVREGETLEPTPYEKAMATGRFVFNHVECIRNTPTEEAA